MFSLAKGYSIDYLTKATAEAREGYYTNAVVAGEPAGVWHGAGAEALGLHGEVDADLMEAVYTHHLDPRDEAARSRSTWGEAATFADGHRKYDSPQDIYKQLLDQHPDAGPEERAALQAQAERSARQALKFIDATFTVTKSVTVVGVAFERAANDARAAGDLKAAAAWGEMHRAVEQAAMVGARATMDYLQDVAGYSRVGHHGGGAGRWVDAHGWVVGQFRQHDSRDRDPNLHVHQAILNRVLCADGQWRTLDSRAIHAHRLSAAAIGERVVEAYLTRTLGLRFETRKDGLAREVVGVPQPVMELFSKRAKAISPKVTEMVAAFEQRFGRAPTPLERKKIAEDATLATRKGKEHGGESLEERLDRWERESRATVKGGLKGVAHAALQQRDAGPATEWSPSLVVKAALAEVGAKQGTWTRSDLLWCVSNALPGHLDIEPEKVRPLLEKLTGQALEEAVCVRKADDTQGLPAEFRLANGRSAYEGPAAVRYTTSDQVVVERINERAAVRTGADALTEGQVAAFLRRLKEAGVKLEADQEEAVRGVLTSGAGVENILAAAGTGKSFTIGVLAEGWAQYGRRTIGLAASQNAADVMADEGVTAFNFERWRTGQEGDVSLQLRKGDLLVVDEAGMASQQDIADIAQRCEAAGAKLLLTGDTRQLGAVGTGGALADISKRSRTYELTEVRRFIEQWEREASLRLRDGDVTALDDYDKHGRLRAAGTQEQAEADAARAWLGDTLAGKKSLLLVNSNEAAARVSGHLREELVRLGRVSEHGIGLGRDGNTAGVGDMVQARRNNWRIGKPVINRQTYRVAEVLDNGRLKVVNAEGHEQTLPAKYVREHLTLAYASTLHAAQGRTVDTGHDLTGSYVGLTRGRESNTAWVVTQATAPDAAAGEAQDVEPRSAKAVLEDKFKRFEEERGALAQQAKAEEDEKSTLTNVDRLIDGIAEMNAGRTSAALDRLAAQGVITDDDRRAFAADSAMPSVDRLLRHAEVSGRDPDALLRDALDGNSLKDANSVGQVLHARIRNTVGEVIPRISSYRDLIPANAPERWREHLERLADKADARRHELGARTAEKPPPWAKETLGPVPADPLRRAVWEARAGWAADHRENTKFEDEQDAIGASPPAGLPEKQAVWATAHDHLDLPDVSAEEGQLTDGRLLVRVAAYEREKLWAPRYVADELAATNERVADQRRNAQLWAERAKTLAGAEREELQRAAAEAAAEAEELERRALDLEEADKERNRWYLHTAVTRDRAARAKAELGRRGVDLTAPEDLTTAEAWLAEEDAAAKAEDEHRTVTEDDVVDDVRDEAATLDGGVETAVPDIREVSVMDRTEHEDTSIRRQVPTADDTADAVARARESLLERYARDSADGQREDEEYGERTGRWLAARAAEEDEEQDERTDTYARRL